MQKDLHGLYGYELIQALSDENGNITENVMFEMLMGFSIGREQLESSPFDPYISIGNIGNKRPGVY